MQFNTALGFILTSGSLVAAFWHKRKLAITLASLGIALGGLTLVQYWLKVDFGIDRFFIEPFTVTQTAHPGRMAPNTALCFVLLGLTIITIIVNRHMSFISFFGTGVAGLGLVAIFGYSTDLETTYGWGHLTKMALHTSINFVILGITVATWGLSKLPRINRWQNNIIVVVTAITWVFVLLQWQGLRGWEEARIQTELVSQTQNLSSEFKKMMNSKIEGLKMHAQYWIELERTLGGPMSRFPKQFLRDFKEFDAVQGVDTSNSVLWQTNLDGDNYFMSRKFLGSRSRKAAFEMAGGVESYGIALTNPGPKGIRAFLIYIPIHASASELGFIVGIMGLDEDLINQVAAPYLLENFQYRIFADSSAVVGRRRPIDPFEKISFATQTVYIGPIPLNFEIIPTKAHRQSLRSSLPTLALFSGMFGVGMLLYLFSLRLKDQTRQARLKNEIGRRSLVERSLEISRRKLKLILDSSREGILEVDAKNIITFCNPMASHLTGYQVEELIGQSYTSLWFHDQSDDITPISPKFYDWEEVGTEAVFKTYDGIAFPVEVIHSPIHDDACNIKGAVISFQDLTERKKQARSILRYNRELERSNKALDEFAYVASHDLKAPLRGIAQLASWIREDLEVEVSDETKEYFNLLQNRIQRMNRLLEDLLHYSRVGNKQADFEEVDCEKMVLEIFKLLTPPPEMTLKIEGSLPTFRTLAVPLDLIFRNLIQNAIKHHDRESGSVTVSAVARTDEYEFAVTDDGPGIPAEHHERVFGIFQTLKSRDEVEGSGMGLAIVKKIVDTYSCRVAIDSEGVRGTKIRFSWPFEPELRRRIHEE